MQLGAHHHSAGGSPERSRTLIRAAAVLLVSVCATSAVAAEPCTGGIGQWNWFIGGQVSLLQDGQVRWGGNGAIPPASGTWKCDPKVGTYVVTWQNGFVDTLTLSPDGRRLTGRSSTGIAVSGARVGAAPGNAPAGNAPTTGTTAAPAAPNGSTANRPSTTTSKPPSSGAIDHNPSVREILQGRPRPDPRGWKQDRSGGPQKGPKPFEGWQ